MPGGIGIRGAFQPGHLRTARAEQLRKAGGPIELDRWAALSPCASRDRTETTESENTNTTRPLTDCCERITGACILLDKAWGGMIATRRP